MSEASQSAPVNSSEEAIKDAGENPAQDVAATVAESASETVIAEAVEIEAVAVEAFAEAEVSESVAAEAFAEAEIVEGAALEAFAEADAVEAVAIDALVEAEAAEIAAGSAYTEAVAREEAAIEAFAVADAIETETFDAVLAEEVDNDTAVEAIADAEAIKSAAVDAIAEAEAVKDEVVATIYEAEDVEEVAAALIDEAEAVKDVAAEAVVEAEVVEVVAAGEIIEAEIVEAAAVDAIVAAEVVAEAAVDAADEVDKDGKRVRTLAVGQEVMGTVKRVSDFGAFVDIGVGRDGLVHISELSVKRVGKVTDVINEGQVLPMWIKKLDRERNRISLTLIPPGTKTLRDVNQGDIVMGTVTRILPYGAFVDIGVGRDALLHVREMGERYIARPEEVVQIGETFEVRIIEVQRRRGRIDLSIKGLRPEPEVENAPAGQQFGEQSEQSGGRVEAAAPVEATPEPVDQFADVEMPSAMELALRKAMDQSGVDLKLSKKKDKQRAETQRRQQEEIYARTLKSSGK